jgi:serine/threonine-protein kinase
VSNIVQINQADFVGLSGSDARTKLQGLGMIANIQTGAPATKSTDAGKVYSVNPTGPVPKGSEITATIYGPVPTPSAPTDKVSIVSPPPPAPVVAGSPVQFAWGAGSCPAGQTMTGHQLYINGTGQGPVATGAPAPWTPPASDKGNTDQVTYTVFCGESVESPQSPALAVPVN